MSPGYLCPFRKVFADQAVGVLFGARSHGEWVRVKYTERSAARVRDCAPCHLGSLIPGSRQCPIQTLNPYSLLSPIAWIFCDPNLHIQDKSDRSGADRGSARTVPPVRSTVGVKLVAKKASRSCHLSRVEVSFSCAYHGTGMREVNDSDFIAF